MTRFDAASESDRLSLFAAGIEAHRERDSSFMTIEAEPPTEGAVPPWTQYSTADQLLNLDCREGEIDDVEAVVEGFGGASILERTSPEEVDGTNFRIRVSGDTDRVAMLIEDVFRDGIGLSAEYRAWVVQI